MKLVVRWETFIILEISKHFIAWISQHFTVLCCMNNLYISILEMYLLDIYSSHLNYSWNFNASKCPFRKLFQSILLLIQVTLIQNILSSFRWISKHGNCFCGSAWSIYYPSAFQDWIQETRKFYSVINDDQTTCSFCWDLSNTLIHL